MERLLFVDDDRELLEINRKFFGNLEYTVDVCQDAPSALKLLRIHRYDVLILDIQMELMNGVELITRGIPLRRASLCRLTKSIPS